MMTGIYKIVVTDFRGNLLFEIKDNDFISLEILDVLNDSGSWKLKSKTKEPCPFGPCNAIIVYRNDIQVYNGYVTKIEEEYEVKTKAWNWTVKGENHIGLLKHRLIYPFKDNIGNLQDRYYRMSPVRADIWIRALITNNACENEDYSHPLSGHRGLWFVEGALEIGNFYDVPAIQEGYRFDNLYEVIYTLATEYNLGIHAVTNPVDYRVMYFIKAFSDKTETVIFSDRNDDITAIRKFTNAPATYSYVTSYNSEDLDTTPLVSANPMWRYVQEGVDAGEWGDLFRETFCEPKKEEFITSYTTNPHTGSDEPNYTWTKTQLYSIAASYAEKGKKETQGIEFSIDPINTKYVYG